MSDPEQAEKLASGLGSSEGQVALEIRSINLAQFLIRQHVDGEHSQT